MSGTLSAAPAPAGAPRRSIAAVAAGPRSDGVCALRELGSARPGLAPSASPLRPGLHPEDAGAASSSGRAASAPLQPSADDARNAALEQLLAATARGDRRAFAALYRATSRRLFGVAVRVLGRDSLAEEALQDAYLSIWRGAASYSRERAMPTTWLVSIVRHRCLDLLRRRTPEVTLEPGDDDRDPLESFADTAPGPAECLAASIAYRQAAARLDGLRPGQRQALALALNEGLSHAAVAARLQVPLGTAKAWIRRGLLELRAASTASPGN